MADFVNIIQDIIGINSDLNAVGVASNASKPVTRESGGVWQRIKDFKVATEDSYSGAVEIKSALWGTDPVNGGEGTVLATIKAAETNTVDLSNDVAAVFEELLVTDVNGSNGIYGDIKTRHQDVVEHEELIHPYYGVIDDIGNDINGKDITGADYTDITGSRLLRVGENIGKGVNSEILEVGKDLVDEDSRIDAVSKNFTYIEAVGKDVVGVSEDITSDSYSHIRHAAENSKLAESAANRSSDNATDSQIRSWIAEAAKMTANSYTNQAEGEHVIVYTSNGDGTFSKTETTDFSAYHYKNEMNAKIASVSISATGSLGFTMRDGNANSIDVYEYDSDYYVSFILRDGTDSDIKLGSV